MAARKWKTARVFISSTFRDMHSERDHLVKVVFPALRERLEKHRIHLVDIDLRWGITEKESRHDRVLDLCLQQIDECRPLFVGILGERYGWVPAAFHEVAASKYGWVQHHTGKSVTELEILYGVLHDPKMREHGLFFFRDPAFIQELPEAKRPDFMAEDNESARKLVELKGAIRQAGLPHPPMENYPCCYAGLRLNWRLVRRELPDADQQALEAVASDGIVGQAEFARLDERLRRAVLRYGTAHLTGLEAFGQAVGTQLWEAIKKEQHFDDVPAETEADPLAEELDYHEGFIESRLRVYVGRESVQEHLVGFADGDATTPCLVTGPSGSGKSAAMAKFARWYAENRPDVLVVPHFVGASPGSTSLRQMLRRFCLVLKNRFALTGEVPEDPNELTGQFRQFVAAVPGGARVVLVIDALNQLDETDGAHSLHWLPAQFPPQVKIVVSCLSDLGKREAVLEAFSQRKHHELPIEPLTDEERRRIIREVPLLSAKTLDERQVALLLANNATANPLFLLVALEELRGFGSFEQLNERIAAFPRKPAAEPGPFPLPDRSVIDIFGQVLHRLEEDFNADIVRAALMYLGSSRCGLLECELQVLVRDKLGAHDLFPALRQLRPYLLNRNGLLDFYHHSLGDAVHVRYLNREKDRRAIHERLAHYFLNASTPARGAPESIWHLVRACQFEVFQAIVTEPHCFIAYWRNDPVLLRECWTQVENGSPLTVVDAYRSLLERPPAGVDTVGPVCELLLTMGHHAESAAPLRDRVARLRAAGNRPALLDALRQLGSVSKVLDDQTGLVAIISEQAQLEAEIGEGQPLFARLGNLAHIAESTGDLPGALALHQQIERAARDAGDRANLHVAISNQAKLLLRQGQTEPALDSARVAVRLARETSDENALAHHLCVEGDVLLTHQDMRSALRCYDEAEMICRRLGDRRMLAHTLANKAIILFHERLMIPDALLCAREAHTLFSDLNRPKDAQISLRLMEDIRRALDRQP